MSPIQRKLSSLVALQMFSDLFFAIFGHWAIYVRVFFKVSFILFDLLVSVYLCVGFYSHKMFTIMKDII